MAAAGGHWVKVASGPMAGKMAFVPSAKSGTLKFGNKEYEAVFMGNLVVAKLNYSNGENKYQLAYYDTKGQLQPIMHKGKAAVFDKQQQALNKADNMHKLGMTKAIKGGDSWDVKEIAKEATLKKTAKTPKATPPGTKTTKTAKTIQVTESGAKNIKAETAAAQAQATKEFSTQADFNANKGPVTVTTAYYKNKIQVDGVMVGDNGEYAVTYNKQTAKYHVVEMQGGTTISTHATANEAFSVGYTAVKNNKPAAANPNFKDVTDLYGTTSQANAIFAKHFAPHTGKLTGDESSALSGYQDGKFDYINSALWGPNPGAATPQVKGWVKNIDTAMKKSPGLPHDTMLYRRKPSGSELYQWAKITKVGATYESKGYDSTSISKDFAHGGSVVLRYRAPKGLSGFFMNTNGYNSQYPHEYEYLLPRNLKWNVIGKSQSGSQIIIDLEYGGTF